MMRSPVNHNPTFRYANDSDAHANHYGKRADCFGKCIVLSFHGATYIQVQGLV